jgi:hypothetical protein
MSAKEDECLRHGLHGALYAWSFFHPPQIGKCITDIQDVWLLRYATEGEHNAIIYECPYSLATRQRMRKVVR